MIPPTNSIKWSYMSKEYDELLQEIRELGKKLLEVRKEVPILLRMLIDCVNDDKCIRGSYSDVGGLRILKNRLLGFLRE